MSSEETTPESHQPEPEVITNDGPPEGPLDLEKIEAGDTPQEAAEPADEATSAETEAPEPEQDAEPVEEEEKPKKKGRFQERIDKLTADKYSAEREAQRLRDELERYKNLEEPEVDPENWEELERRRVRQALRDERTYENESRLRQVQEEAMQHQVQVFHAKVEEASERIPDLYQALEVFKDLPVTTDSASLIAESDQAAEIAYYLGKNPKAAYDLAKLSPVQQGKAIAQIEARVKPSPKKVTKAPAPAKTIAPQSASPASKDPAKMSAKEYAEMRKAQWAKGER